MATHYNGYNGPPPDVDEDAYDERRLGDLVDEVAAKNAGASALAMDSISTFEERARQEAALYLPPPAPHYEMPASSRSQPQCFVQRYDDPYAHANSGSGQYYAPPPAPSSSSSSGQTLALSHPQTLYLASPPPDEQRSIFGVRPDHHGGHPHSNSPYQAGDPRVGNSLPEFARWSQTWYGGHLSQAGYAYTAVRPPSGRSGWESETVIQPDGAPYGQPYGPPASYEAYMYGDAPRGLRSDYPAPYDANGAPSEALKEERIRILEKKFGKPKVKHRGDDAADEGLLGVDGEPEETEEAGIAAPPIGGVSLQTGRLRLPWHRTLLLFKTLLVLCSLAAFLFAILDAFLIKPATNDMPDIKSSWTSWILHAVSMLSAVVTSWLFLLRPLCCDRARKVAKGDAIGPGMDAAGSGRMVLPVLADDMGSADRKGGLFGGKKRRRQRGADGQGPTVNLIVDSAMLDRGAKHGGSDSDSASGSQSDTDSDFDSEDDDPDAGPDRRNPFPGGASWWGRGPRQGDPAEIDRQERRRSAERRRRRRQQKRRRRKKRGQSHLLRAKTRRVHALALSSLRFTLLGILLLTLLQGGALIVVFIFAKPSGAATKCESTGSSWCLAWRAELACVIVACILALAWQVLGWMGHSAARREGKSRA